MIKIFSTIGDAKDAVKKLGLRDDQVGYQQCLLSNPEHVVIIYGATPADAARYIEETENGSLS